LTFQFWKLLFNFKKIIWSKNYVTKKKGTPTKHPQVSVWPPWTLLPTLQATNSLVLPWLVTTQGLLCRTTQCNFRSHRWLVRTSCLTTQKLLGLWPQIEHLQCTCQPDITDRHHSTSQINFLSFISQKTLRQHKLLDPCHHLICSTTLRSEARTCQLLIAAEEKTSNPTPKRNVH